MCSEASGTVLDRTRHLRQGLSIQSLATTPPCRTGQQAAGSTGGLTRVPSAVDLACASLPSLIWGHEVPPPLPLAGSSPVVRPALPAPPCRPFRDPWDLPQGWGHGGKSRAGHSARRHLESGRPTESCQAPRTAGLRSGTDVPRSRASKGVEGGHRPGLPLSRHPTCHLLPALGKASGQSHRARCPRHLQPRPPRGSAAPGFSSPVPAEDTAPQGPALQPASCAWWKQQHLHPVAGLPPPWPKCERPPPQWEALGEAGNHLTAGPAPGPGGERTCQCWGSQAPPPQHLGPRNQAQR